MTTIPNIHHCWSSPDSDLSFLEILTPRVPLSAQPAYVLMIHLTSGYARIVEVA